MSRSQSTRTMPLATSAVSVIVGIAEEARLAVDAIGLAGLPMLGCALSDIGLDRAQRVGAAERVDRLLDQISRSLGRCRLCVANGHAQRSRQQKCVSHAIPPSMTFVSWGWCWVGCVAVAGGPARGTGRLLHFYGAVRLLDRFVLTGPSLRPMPQRFQRDDAGDKNAVSASCPVCGGTRRRGDTSGRGSPTAARRRS